MATNSAANNVHLLICEESLMSNICTSHW